MQSNLARSLLLLACIGMGAEAQETDIEAMEPAVTSAELESLEPGVSGTALEDAGPEQADRVPPAEAPAQNVRRRENATGVMDEIDLGRTEITGNQELPKVLYIVPWQKSDPGDLSGKPVNTLLDEVLAPIDRSEFVRQVDYYGDLYVEDEE